MGGPLAKHERASGLSGRDWPTWEGPAVLGQHPRLDLLSKLRQALGRLPALELRQSQNFTTLSVLGSVSRAAVSCVSSNNYLAKPCLRRCAAK